MKYSRVRETLGELNNTLEDALYTCKLIGELSEVSSHEAREVRAISRKILGAKTDLILLMETGGE